MSDKNLNVRRYNMYPQKSFAGHVEAEVMQDGQIKYTIFPFPFDGSDARTIVLDPANPEDIRAIRQLHLQADVNDVLGADDDKLRKNIT